MKLGCSKSESLGSPAKAPPCDRSAYNCQITSTIGDIFSCNTVTSCKPELEPTLILALGPRKNQRVNTIVPKKSVFNRIIGDSHFELEFAAFLEKCDDIVSYAKNFLAVGFKLDYKNANGEISNYYPDFIVKVKEKEIFIIETKGNEDLDDPLKLERLKQWCGDVNVNQSKVTIRNLYVTQEKFNKSKPSTFKDLVRYFS